MFSAVILDTAADYLASELLQKGLRHGSFQNCLGEKLWLMTIRQFFRPGDEGGVRLSVIAKQLISCAYDRIIASRKTARTTAYSEFYDVMGGLKVERTVVFLRVTDWRLAISISYLSIIRNHE